jgi:hypothetical protein
MSKNNNKLTAIRVLVCCIIVLTSVQSNRVLADRQDMSVGSVVISELMPNIDDSEIDWIEFYNTTDTKIDLKNCVVSDANFDKLIVTQSLPIEAKGYMVIASGREKAIDAPAVLRQPAWEYSTQDLQLTTGPDQVQLKCNGKLIDKVTYDQYSPGPASKSRGWQLSPSALDSVKNDDLSNWCYTNLPILSEDNYYGNDKVASPGRENPQCSRKVLPHIYVNDQQAVLINGIDWVTTMRIAEEELTSDMATAELTIWAIRDQLISPAIAEKISSLYLDNIDRLYHAKPVAMIDSNHAVWHFAWAISNLYRNGNDEVKAALQTAYDDALTRPDTLPRFRLIAIDNVQGDLILMGDAHDRARSFVRKHVVVPGNPDYIQNYEEYLENKRSGVQIFFINILYNTKSFFDDIF